MLMFGSRCGTIYALGVGTKRGLLVAWHAGAAGTPHGNPFLGTMVDSLDRGQAWGMGDLEGMVRLGGWGVARELKDQSLNVAVAALA